MEHCDELNPVQSEIEHGVCITCQNCGWSQDYAVSRTELAYEDRAYELDSEDRWNDAQNPA